MRNNRDGRHGSSFWQKKMNSLIRLMPRLAGMALLCAGIAAQAQRDPWQDHTVFRINKEDAHASLFPFENKEEAIGNRMESSPWYLPLDGIWKFNFALKPDERPRDFYAEKFDAREWDDIKVPANWETEGYDRPIYLDEKYPFDAKWPDAPQNYNPVGSYKRYFELPSSWKGREIFIQLGAVNSAFFIWINGTQAGYSEDSKTPAEFNITKYVREGSNSVSLQVFRWSDGSYLEAQDMLKLSGIERSVFLFSTPKVHVFDYFFKGDLDDKYQDGILDLSVQVRNYSKRASSCFLEAALLDDSQHMKTVWSRSQKLIAASEKPRRISFKDKISNPRKWSAETPNLYSLLILIKDQKGTALEAISGKVGFRKIEIKNAQLRVNGKAIKIKGVNRHEAEAAKGHVISKEVMLHDIDLMKKANINAVRGSHYPNSAEWHNLMDRYGFYVVDEANNESHPLALNESTKLGTEMSWLPAFIDRTRNMFERDKNHPSIIMWSLGNESGDGPLFDSTYHWLRRHDARPVIYEPAGLQAYTDVYVPMYPKIPKITDYAKSNPTRPLIMCEYAHMMGNSGGNLQDYWNEIEKYPSLQGGFIWEWADQGLFYVSKLGVKYLAYGNDYHPDIPTDGAFVNKGLVNGYRLPIPHYYEVKKVYQPVSFHALNVRDGEFEIENKYAFSDLKHLKIHWEASADGAVIAKGSLGSFRVMPGERMKIKIPLSRIKPTESEELILKLSAAVSEEKPFLPTGYELAWNQFVIKGRINAAVSEVGEVAFFESDKGFKAEGKDFSVFIDKKNGLLSNYKRNNKELLSGCLQPQFWRAPTDNDVGNKMHEWAAVWREAANYLQLVRCEVIKSTACAAIIESRFRLSKIESQLTLTYSIFPQGEVKIDYHFTPGKMQLPDIPRVGMTLRMPQEFQYMCWYGCGPHDSYWDRKSGAAVGQYCGSVWGQSYLYPRPQETGNKADIRWMSVVNSEGAGLKVAAVDELLSASVWQFSQEDLDFKLKTGSSASGLVPNVSKHSYDVSPRDFTTWNIDLLQMGVGGDDSWGAPVHEEYRIKPGEFRYSFIIKGVSLFK